MKMIGASWGRTGTTSLTAALERLGLGPVCHMQRMFEHPDEAVAWAGYRRGEPTDVPGLLGRYGAAFDWPACWAWEDAAALYPEAPVLLSTRDASEWYASVRGSIHRWAAPDREYDDAARSPSPEAADLLFLVWSSHFGSWEALLDEPATVRAYEAHVAHVHETCPPGRLVEWSAGDGWAPLCDALGLPVPDEPFPHLNRRADRPGANDDPT